MMFKLRKRWLLFKLKCKYTPLCIVFRFTNAREVDKIVSLDNLIPWIPGCPTTYKYKVIGWIVKEDWEDVIAYLQEEEQTSRALIAASIKKDMGIVDE